MTLYLVQHQTSGDVYVTDETAMSDALHYTAWQDPDTGKPRTSLDLADFELDPGQPFHADDCWTYLT